MQNFSVKFLAAGTIAAVFAVVAYTMFQSNTFPFSKKIVEPSGQISFIAREADTHRNYPLAYDVQSAEFVPVQNNPETFYIQTLADQSTATLQAPYFEREADDLYYPYSGDPKLVAGEKELVLDNIVNPSQLAWSTEADLYTFHGLSRNWTNQTEPEFYFASENYQDSENWAVYTANIGDGVVNEVATGHSPVWSKDGQYIFYLTVKGISIYEIASGLSWAMAELPGRLPTPASSLALSSDGNELYVLTTAFAVSPDKLFVLDVSPLKEPDLSDVVFPFLRETDLPEGNHLDLTLSPDNNYAVVTTYGEDYFELHALNLQTEQLQKNTLFRQSGIEKYYHFPYVSWTDLSPKVFD